MMALSIRSINLAYCVTMYVDSNGNNEFKIKILRLKLYKFPLYYKKDLFEGLIKLFFSLSCFVTRSTQQLHGILFILCACD